MFATAAALCTGVAVATAPAGSAAVCGSVGGARVDVSGCADPFYELNDALPPPPPPAYVPPPPPPAYVPPPPPPPNVSVCADVGRRINVSGCV
ncbi:MAG: RNA-binding protein [Actinobacteria bacterium]|nr:RNA-binding protein [Actinomycetota bacterium]